MTGRPPSGRPAPEEYAEYAAADIARVGGDDAVAALAQQGAEVASLFSSTSDAAVSGLRYASGKWTVKEVLGHLCDDERIFVYRALCIARGDGRPLAGFDERRYVEHAGFETRRLDDLVAEYIAIRRATVLLFAGLPADAWHRRGEVNGYQASVRGLAYHIAGHELRHIESLAAKYGLRASA